MSSNLEKILKIKSKNSILIRKTKNDKNENYKTNIIEETREDSKILNFDNNKDFTNSDGKFIVFLDKMINYFEKEKFVINKNNKYAANTKENLKINNAFNDLQKMTKSVSKMQQKIIDLISIKKELLEEFNNNEKKNKSSIKVIKP